MKPNLLMLTRYSRNGASSRQRMLIYKSELEASGVDVTVKPFFSEDYLNRLYAGHSLDWVDVARSYFQRLRLAFESRRFSIVWVEKELLPWLPSWLERALVGELPVVVDIDDAWHLRGRKAGALFGLNMREKYDRVVRQAHGVTVANENLEMFWNLRSKENVLRLPTVIDTGQYCVNPEPDTKFTVGWIGTPVTLPYLAEIAPVLRRLSADGARLLVIGGGKRVVQLDGVDVESVEWSEESEARHLANCHVGIMPLPDGEWERYKSGYKLIQYMAAGRPAVASPVGENRNILCDNVTGFFADRQEDWYQALTRLRVDGDTRRGFGIAARERCARMFSSSSQVGSLVEFMHGAMSRQSASGRIGWSATTSVDCTGPR